jgi:hypothetical protein
LWLRVVEEQQPFQIHLEQAAVGPVVLEQALR